MSNMVKYESRMLDLRGGGGGGGAGQPKFLGKTRFGDRVYQKAPSIGGTFGEVSGPSLHATAGPVNGHRLELELYLIMHPIHPNNSLSGRLSSPGHPCINLSGLDQK